MESMQVWISQTFRELTVAGIPMDGTEKRLSNSWKYWLEILIIGYEDTTSSWV